MPDSGVLGEPILVVLAGLPGTGKTTLAKLLVRELGAAYLRTDPIAGAMLRGHLTSEPAEAGRVAYLVAEEVCIENLENGVPVVVDGVNALHERRAIWPKVARRADVPLAMLETTLCDPRVHRLRIEEREATSEPNSVSPWQSVLGMTYDPWDEALYGERQVVDMTETAAGLAVALTQIRSVRSRWRRERISN